MHWPYSLHLLHTNKVCILENYISQAQWLPQWCFTPTQIPSLGWYGSLCASTGLRYMLLKTLPSYYSSVTTHLWIIFLNPREFTVNTLLSTFIYLNLTNRCLAKQGWETAGKMNSNYKYTIRYYYSKVVQLISLSFYYKKFKLKKKTWESVWDSLWLSELPNVWQLMLVKN